MKYLNITARLAISIIFLLLALGIVTDAYIGTIANHVERSRLEKAGIVYLRPVIRILNEVAEYNALQLHKAAGDNSIENRLTEVKENVDNAFEALRDTHSGLALTLQLTDNELRKRNLESLNISHLSELWLAITAENSTTTSGKASKELLDNLEKLTVYIAEVSTLALDPEATGYYLMHASVFSLIENIRHITESESDIYRALAGNIPMTLDEKLKIWALATMIEENDVKVVVADFQTSYHHAQKTMVDPSALRKATEQKLQNFVDANHRLASSLRASVTEAQTSYNEQFFAARKAAYSLWTAGIGELESLMDERIDYFVNIQNKEILKAMVASIIGLAFFWYVTHGIIRSLKKVEVAMQEVAHGDLDYEVPYLNLKDEIGGIARALEKFRKSYWWLKLN